MQIFIFVYVSSIFEVISQFTSLTTCSIKVLALSCLNPHHLILRFSLSFFTFDLALMRTSRITSLCLVATHSYEITLQFRQLSLSSSHVVNLGCVYFTLKVTKWLALLLNYVLATNKFVPIRFPSNMELLIQCYVLYHIIKILSKFPFH